MSRLFRQRPLSPVAPNISKPGSLCNRQGHPGLTKVNERTEQKEGGYYTKTLDPGVKHRDDEIFYILRGQAWNAATCLYSGLSPRLTAKETRSFLGRIDP